MARQHPGQRLRRRRGSCCPKAPGAARLQQRREAQQQEGGGRPGRLVRHCQQVSHDAAGRGVALSGEGQRVFGRKGEMQTQRWEQMRNRQAAVAGETAHAKAPETPGRPAICGPRMQGLLCAHLCSSARKSRSVSALALRALGSLGKEGQGAGARVRRPGSRCGGSTALLPAMLHASRARTRGSHTSPAPHPPHLSKHSVQK